MENCSYLDLQIDLNDEIWGSDFEMSNVAETPDELENLADTPVELNDRAGTPAELIEVAEEAGKKLLPEKSLHRYEQVYRQFKEWKKTKAATSNSERVLLAYFKELSDVKGLAASSLWAKYSMIKKTLSIKEKVDITGCAQLTAFLKVASENHEPKQAKIFTEEEMKRFLDSAPDDLWLDVKTVCAFGILGACRTHELPQIRMEHITRYSDMLYVSIPKTITKTKKDNSFAITGEMLGYVQKYERLRPSHVKTDRFFLNFQKGKCTIQTIGKGKFYKMPSRIATYLNLPEPQLYTGHSLRRSSVTFLANTGATIEDIKRHTGHKSTKVAEMYIGDSVAHKRKTSNATLSSLGSGSPSSMSPSSTISTAETAGTSSGVLRALDHNVPYIKKALEYKPVISTKQSPLNRTSTSIDLKDGTENDSTDGTSANEYDCNSHDSNGTSSIRNWNGLHEETMCCDGRLVNETSNNGRDNVGALSSQMSYSGKENDYADGELTQVSVSQHNFLSRLEKQFSFYKCEGITINVNTNQSEPERSFKKQKRY